jgi:two-component system, chemotaxis family, protein-glutamate methylesterase/glutaminase
LTGTVSKARVLIVDDAVVVRKVLSDELSRDPALEVVGSASNGRMALTKFFQLHPDIVLLDHEMPEMTGLETIPELRKLNPKVRIIMFSTLTERGASVTLDALALGASDYITKPKDLETSSRIITQELIPKIKALCGITSPVTSSPISSSKGSALFHKPLIPPAPVKIVAIGVSTGGSEALGKVLPCLPANFPVPVVIAQHMPPIFTAMLASRLSKKTLTPVRECKAGDLLDAGIIWVAPGDYHMEVRADGPVIRLHTHQEPPQNFCRPSVDVLFRSVANLYGAHALGVVLTGMGQDGYRGSEALVSEGARIVVQDEATSVVWGMPGFVARAGLADRVLPLEEIGSEIVRRVDGVARHAIPS